MLVHPHASREHQPFGNGPHARLPQGTGRASDRSGALAAYFQRVHDRRQAQQAGDRRETPLSHPQHQPVPLDGIVSDARIVSLLELGTEYASLDYKASVAIDSKPGLVELAKDIGAMLSVGGYILIGVDQRGKPTGDMDAVATEQFDEARLRAKLRKYLPNDVLQLATQAVTIRGHAVIAISVGPSPLGGVPFTADGTYLKDGKEVVAFREGEIWVRDGTSNRKVSHAELLAMAQRRDRDQAPPPRQGFRVGGAAEPRLATGAADALAAVRDRLVDGSLGLGDNDVANALAKSHIALHGQGVRVMGSPVYIPQLGETQVAIERIDEVIAQLRAMTP